MLRSFIPGLALLAGCSDGTAPDPVITPNYIRIVSEDGDYVGRGETYEYTEANAVITVTATGAYLHIDVQGNESAGLSLQLPDTYSTLEVGTYTNLKRYPYHELAAGGVQWAVDGIECAQSIGSATIDSRTYDDGELTAIDLRFEQRCDGTAGALRGTIHWRADDTTTVPGPLYPEPAGLWRPPTSAIPPAGTFVYLISDAGDPIGEGGTFTYSPANATISAAIDPTTGALGITVEGAESWSGEFAPMQSIDRLQRGYYGDLRRYPFHNPLKGGLSWSGSIGCNEVTGWFVLESVSYTDDTLTSFQLRFEQHCERATPALRGMIRWSAPPPSA